jgi:serine/threonine-protein kinase
VSKQSDETAPAGYVTRQEPEPGQHVDSGAAVNLWISSGPPPENSGRKAAANAGGTDNGDEKARKTGRVRVKVPASPRVSSVRIVVTDDRGPQTVYNQLHNPGDVVDETVSGVGHVTIEVFVNDQSVQKKVL